MEKEKRIAVLIDSDNVSSKYITSILDEVSKYGNITYKRIYGDWTSGHTSNWKEVLLSASISPIQQYSYTRGKNSTDSAMIIDAMDILYTQTVEGFCLVSSDSDFTRLAARLRESGMFVIGMGEHKTPKAFTSACSIFKYLDIFAETDETPHKAQSGKSIDPGMTDERTISLAIQKILDEGYEGYEVDEEKGMDIAVLGNHLLKKFPEFDVRNYGYSKLSTFLNSIQAIDLIRTKTSIFAQLKESRKLSPAMLVAEIKKILKASKGNMINMGELNKQIKENHPDFNVRNLGYTKFSKFLTTIPEIEIIELNVRLK
ncbi:MAG: hypothetical protein CR988_00680 [Treponema sp.]|nr:MAG: hypothetical protein CR988_00680 [Treponema sp.]